MFSFRSAAGRRRASKRNPITCHGTGFNQEIKHPTAVRPTNQDHVFSCSATRLARATLHARPFVGVFESQSLRDVVIFLAINAPKMAPRTTPWFQGRPWDAPTKGLARTHRPASSDMFRRHAWSLQCLRNMSDEVHLTRVERAARPKRDLREGATHSATHERMIRKRMAQNPHLRFNQRKIGGLTHEWVWANKDLRVGVGEASGGRDRRVTCEKAAGAAHRCHSRADGSWKSGTQPALKVELRKRRRASSGG